MHGLINPIARRFWHLALMTAVVSLASCSREAKKERALKRADGYFQAKRYDEAKIEYANVLKLDPENARAIKNMGTLWMEQGTPIRALPFLVHTCRKNSADLEARTQLATAFLAVDARAEAANAAASILHDQPDNGQALALLADAARLPKEIEQVSQRIDAFPKKDIAPYHLALGSMRLKRGEIAMAEASFAEASRLDLQNPLSHLALANIAIVKKQTDQAQKHYQIAGELAAPRSLPSIALAEFLFQSKRLKEAAAALQPAVTKAPDYIPARRLNAQIAFALGNKEEGLKQIREVLRQDPENLEGSIIQSQMWFAEGSIPQATELLERTAKRVPKNPVVRFELARCANASGNGERAIEILDELVRSKPDYAQAVLVLNELRLRKGNAAEAASALGSFCEQRENYPPALLLLAQSYRALGRYADAIAIYRKLEKVENGRGDMTFLIGVTHRQANQLGEAEACFLDVLKLNPKAFAPLEQLVGIDLLRKDYSRASERVASAVQGGLQSAELELLKARIEAAQGKWDLAEAGANRAGEMDPNLPGVDQLLINIYLAGGKLESALKQAELLSEQKPDDLRAFNTVAAISARLGQSEKAIGAYERVLSKNPDSASTLNNLACLYLEQPSQVEKAYALARKARAQMPSDPAVADTLGWVCFKKKDFPQALGLLRESSSQLAENAEVLYHYGMACYAMGLWTDAISALEKASALPQQFSSKSEIPPRVELLKTPEKFSIEQLSAMGKRTPDDIGVWHRLGEKLRDAGQHKEAAAAFENALKINPQVFPCIVELAMLNAGPLQNTQAAAELSKRALSASPGDAESKLALGKLAYRTKDWTQAYVLLGETSYQLKSAATSLALARSAFALGKISEATELISSVAKTGPSKEQEEANRLLAVLDPATPASDVRVREALSQSPDDPVIVIAAAKEAQKLGDRGEAGRYFDRALKLLPDSPILQKELAAFYLQDPVKLLVAHDYAAKARRSLPDDAEVAATFAETSFRREDFGNARLLFEECEKGRPLTPRERYYLAVCHSKLKEPRAAVDAIQAALSGGLPDPLREEAQKLLQECEAQLKQKGKES